MTDQALSDRCSTRKPNRVVTGMMIVMPVLVCLLAAAPHAQALRRARGFLSGVQLSAGEQKKFGEWNRTLLLRDVGIPEPLTVRSVEDEPVMDGAHADVVIAMETRFVLDVSADPVAILAVMIERFEDHGFRRGGEPDPVTLKRRGVTVSLTSGEQSTSIEVHRDW